MCSYRFLPITFGTSAPFCVSSEGQGRFPKWWNFRRNSTTHLKEVKESLCPCWVPED